MAKDMRTKIRTPHRVDVGLLCPRLLLENYGAAVAAGWHEKSDIPDFDQLGITPFATRDFWREVD